MDGLGVDMLRGKMPSPGREDNVKVAHIVFLFPFLETLVARHLSKIEKDIWLTI